MTRLDLRPLLAPRSIAIVGASESPDSWAPEIYRSLRHVGFEGEIHPVNPKYDEVWDRPCRPSIAELPRGVDLAVFVVPAGVVVATIDDCARAGVRAAMVVSSGFAEAGDEGRALQEELRRKAMRARIPVLGPNVEGFVNYVDRVAPYGTTPPPEPVAGGISVISQSGTVAWALSQQASDRAEGLRIVLGVGNEAVIGLGEMFEWAAADRHTLLVASYVETMRDVEGIGRGLEALRAARKPIVVCAPAAESEPSRRSIVAHTGALAGDTALRDAWLRGHGAVLADDPAAMFEALVLLSHHRRLRTTGVAAALQSGGACTLFAEAAGALGLSLPELAPRTKATLRRRLPAFASQNNPLDVTGQAAVEIEMFEAALRALANDPNVGLVAFDAFPPRLSDESVWSEPVLRTVREVRRTSGVAFASLAMNPLAYGDAAKRFVAGAGLPFLQGHRAAAGGIRALVHLQDTGASRIADVPPHPNRPAAVRLLRGRVGPLDEARAARLLELYGVRRPREAVASTPAAAASASRSIGFPVAVKALAPGLPHKAKLGGVRLGLGSATAVAAAASEVLAAANRAGAARPRVLVQRMASGAEVLVGAVVDERFGAFVTLRPGGAMAEAGAPTFVPAPLTP
ncbi:MAG: acetate--CoA ligase family protein, partial [Actinomycetota bacterium]